MFYVCDKRPVWNHFLGLGEVSNAVKLEVAPLLASKSRNATPEVTTNRDKTVKS